MLGIKESNQFIMFEHLQKIMMKLEVMVAKVVVFNSKKETYHE